MATTPTLNNVCKIKSRRGQNHCCLSFSWSALLEVPRDWWIVATQGTAQVLDLLTHTETEFLSANAERTLLLNGQRSQLCSDSDPLDNWVNTSPV